MLNEKLLLERLTTGPVCFENISDLAPSRGSLAVRASQLRSMGFEIQRRSYYFLGDPMNDDRTLWDRVYDDVWLQYIPENEAKEKHRQDGTRVQAVIEFLEKMPRWQVITMISDKLEDMKLK